MTGSLKISLSISLAVHAVIGVAYCLLQKQHATPLAPSDPILTINLIKDFAPSQPPAKLVQTPQNFPPPPQKIIAKPAPVSRPDIEPFDPLPMDSTPVAVKKNIVPIPALEKASTPVKSIAAEKSPAPKVETSSAQIGFSSAENSKPDILARPAYRKNADPVYPLAARRRHEEGTVLLSVTINTLGKAIQVQLKKSSGFAVLDEAAIKTVRDWEFEPARLNQMPVESAIEVPVRYQLTE